jgi:hypothetical protein
MVGHSGLKKSPGAGGRGVPYRRSINLPSSKTLAFWMQLMLPMIEILALAKQGAGELVPTR